MRPGAFDEDKHVYNTTKKVWVQRRGIPRYSQFSGIQVRGGVDENFIKSNKTGGNQKIHAYLIVYQEYV